MNGHGYRWLIAHGTTTHGTHLRNDTGGQNGAQKAQIARRLHGHLHTAFESQLCADASHELRIPANTWGAKGQALSITMPARI